MCGDRAPDLKIKSFGHEFPSKDACDNYKKHCYPGEQGMPGYTVEEEEEVWFIEWFKYYSPN